MTGTVMRRKGFKNKWRLYVRLGYDQNGKELRKTKTVTALNKSEAQRQLSLWLIELQRYDLSAGHLTVKSFAELWLPKYVTMEELAPRTVDSYTRLLNRYIYPALGKVLLVDLTPLKLVGFIDKLLTEKVDSKQRRSATKQLSPLTVKTVYYLLNNMIRTAYRWDLIPSNPMDKVDPPKGKPTPPKIFKTETIRNVFTALAGEDDEYQLMVLLALTTGCREGELLGLSWDDFNDDERTFFIHQTVQYTKAKGTYLYPHTKTENSKRDIFVIPQLDMLLGKAKSRFDYFKGCAGDGWNKNNLVFFQPDGEPVRPNYLSNRFTDFIRDNHIEHLRFHDLRGYFATQLMISGHSLPDIIKRTGHSKASTLLDYYGHAIQEHKEIINKTITTTYDEISGIKTLPTK